jgi:hypothetical protein
MRLNQRSSWFQLAKMRLTKLPRFRADADSSTWRAAARRSERVADRADVWRRPETGCNDRIDSRPSSDRPPVDIPRVADVGWVRAAVWDRIRWPPRPGDLVRCRDNRRCTRSDVRVAPHSAQRASARQRRRPRSITQGTRPAGRRGARRHPSSFEPQRLHRIDAQCPPCREEAGRPSDTGD